jgi:hypothetical protein
VTVTDQPEPIEPTEPTQPQTEPATSFKWVIVVAVVVWTLGALMIFLTRF